MIQGVACNVLGKWLRGMSPEEVLAHPSLEDFPAVRAGLEMAFRSFNAAHPFLWWESAFTEGRQSIPINGLIWMDSLEAMEKAAHEKIAEGFSCIKLKIGFHSFDRELELIRRLRQHYGTDVQLRLDANGAFPPEAALDHLERLAPFHIHSVEQPIAPGQPETMAQLVKASPIPIALDEELISAPSEKAMHTIIEAIRPPYIILKPSLLGGMMRSERLLQRVRRQGGDGWVTSALESNLGLAAIAQWTATFALAFPQGLGTGSLYRRNFTMPLHIKAGHLHWTPPPPDVQSTIFPLL